MPGFPDCVLVIGTKIKKMALRSFMWVTTKV